MKPFVRETMSPSFVVNEIVTPPPGVYQIVAYASPNPETHACTHIHIFLLMHSTQHYQQTRISHSHIHMHTRLDTDIYRMIHWEVHTTHPRPNGSQTRTNLKQQWSNCRHQCPGTERCVMLLTAHVSNVRVYARTCPAKRRSIEPQCKRGCRKCG